MLTLPGLIDPHVHSRDPGQTEKEDFYTGTCAALAGGYTTVLDMPNNKTPITTLERLEEKIRIAKEKIVCDVGFYFGSLGDNLKEFEKVNPPAGGKVRGIKLYLNQTTGNFLLDQKQLSRVFSTWPKELIILVHAENEAIDTVLKTARTTRRKTHFCHISNIYELSHIIEAKEEGFKVTCGVTPHHLFLTRNDEKTLGPFGKMKPPLQKKEDVEFLWKHLKAIDLIESDHAPHTVEEKLGKQKTKARGDTAGRAPDSAHALFRRNTSRALAGGKVVAGPRAEQTPNGVPGLETTLPLLLAAVSQKRLSLDDLIRLCHENPKRIFNIQQDNSTYIEVDKQTSYEIKNKNLFTKCKWSPFAGYRVKGKVIRVWIRGTKVFEDGKVLVKPGFGKII